jgi:GT2 family glycosyltransferase/2-polyprenyl-3-methyl-5-hydroxy-6-metoxy-1,4-benzoquinol methylase
MHIHRIALIFDNELRPETTGMYCLRALRQSCYVEHFLPRDLDRIPRSGFDLYLCIDDGLRHRLPSELRPSAWWVIDTHLDTAWAEEKGRDFDWLFAAQRDGAEGLKQAGLPAHWLPLACDPEIHRPHPLGKHWDFGFVGKPTPGPRGDLLTLLHRRFPNSFIGQAYFEEYARVLAQSWLGFNRSVKNDVNMRVFETPACGTLLITNDLRDNGQEDLLTSDQHCVTYQSADELLDKLRFYLAHVEIGRRITIAGHDEVLARHTYRHRMQSLLEVIQGTRPPHTVPVTSESTSVGQAVPDATCPDSEQESASQHDEPVSGDQPYSVHESHPSYGETHKVEPAAVDATTSRQAQPDLQLDSIDVVIKTFLRPQALLRLLQSISEFYPHAHVTIADDGNLRESADANSRACCAVIDENDHFDLHSLPFAAGATAGRNLLVDKTHRPYILLLDDDFYFTAETRIEKLLERLQSNSQLGVVAGACIDVVGDERRPRNSGGTLRIEGDTLYVDTTGWLDREQALRDYVPHFALIRREVFGDIRWQGGLGAEHYDFCLQLQSSPWQVAQDLAVQIDHYHFSAALPGYAEHRLNYVAAQQWLLKKWKLRRIVQDGKVIVELADKDGKTRSSSVGQAVPDAMCPTSEQQHASQCNEPSPGNKPDLGSRSHSSSGHAYGLELAATDATAARQAQPDLRAWASGAAKAEATAESSDIPHSALRIPRSELLNKDAFYFDSPRPEVVALIPSSARRVLDIGCGAGALGALLKQRQVPEVVGIELQPRAAALARERLDQVLEQDVEGPFVEFPAESFDCIVCADVLEHVREPEQLLEKIRRWLAPGGCLVASIPNVRHHSVVTSLIEGNWTYESAGLLDSDHVRFFTRREIEKLLYRQGFELQDMHAILGPGDETRRAAGGPGHVRIGPLDISGMPSEAADEFFAYQYLVVARPTFSPLGREGQGVVNCPETETQALQKSGFVSHRLTSIIIVTHNQCACTKECVDSIRLRTDEPYELIFVDNGSSDRTVEYLRSVSLSVAGTLRVPSARLIENTDNRGFPAAVNQALKISRGEYVVLLNNDTVVTTGWLRRMQEVLDSDPRIGLVGPCSNYVSGPQCVSVAYQDMVSLDGFAWDWGKRHCGVIEETDRLVGFCLAIKRAVIDQIGLLDEQFGVGCFEDDDLCLRALRAGWRTVIARAAFVHHYGNRTFQGSGIDLGAVLNVNRQKFLDKWVTSPPLRKGGPGGVALSNSPEAISNQPLAGTNSELRTPNSALQPRPPHRETDVSRSPRLSLCMIVRDNESTIGPALESIRPWVDEIIVVDTGSQDKTPDICRQYGAQVFDFPWCDDFSAARNESLKRARGKWIFWMDSDDTISPECGQKLRNLVDRLCQENPDDRPSFPSSAWKRPRRSSVSTVEHVAASQTVLSAADAASHDRETHEAELPTRRSQTEPGNETNILGYIMQVHCPSPGEEGQLDVTIVDHVKLIRNRPDLRFEGRIHEQLLPVIRRAGGDVAWTDIHVVHSGSDHSPEGWQRKLERDLRILHRELEETPDHPFVLFNLGMTYADAARARPPLVRGGQGGSRDLVFDRRTTLDSRWESDPRGDRGGIGEPPVSPVEFVGQAVADSLVPPPESAVPNANNLTTPDGNRIQSTSQAQPDLRNSTATCSDLAIGFLQQCLAVSPPESSHVRKAFALLISTLSQADRHDEAWTACQKGLALYADDKELLFRSAMLHHHFGRLREAETAYLQVLSAREERHLTSIDQGLAGFKARHNLAIVYEDMGRFNEAEAQWRRITRDVPSYSQGWLGLQQVLGRQGKRIDVELLCDRLNLMTV